jgi:hypothetical protein
MPTNEVYMKHKLLATFCLIIGSFQLLPAVSYITHADEITEEWLVEAGAATGYTEHVRHFRRLFAALPVRGLLEFGVGFSTKYFIDHCEKVISVEFVTPGSGPEWIKYCIDLYPSYPNWTPIVYFAGNGLDTSWAPNKYLGDISVYHAAAYQPVYKKSYALIDSTFLNDLNAFIDQQVSCNDIDVAFVDSGVCIRGDLVQSLFNKVPIILAHDISSAMRRSLPTTDDVYGYGRMIIPDNYEEIYIPFGMGTGIWVSKDPKYANIINDLKEYAAQPEPLY